MPATSVLIVVLTVTAAATAAEANFILHNFAKDVNGSDPDGVVRAPDGTLYGTAYWSGDSNCGTLFKINADGEGFTVVPAAAALAHCAGALSQTSYPDVELET